MAHHDKVRDSQHGIMRVRCNSRYCEELYGSSKPSLRQSSINWQFWERAAHDPKMTAITSLLSRKRMSISLSNIGSSQQLYGMVNRSLDSWQRRISMIYRQLVSRTSIQCGHFQLPLSTRIGNRWHSEWLHGILFQIQIEARKHCRVNRP